MSVRVIRIDSEGESSEDENSEIWENFEKLEKTNRVAKPSIKTERDDDTTKETTAVTCAHAIKIEPDQRLVDLEAENKKLKAQVEKLKAAKGKRVSSSPLPHIFEVLCGAAKTMKTEEFMFKQKKQQQQQNLQQQRQQQRDQHNTRYRIR